MALENHREKWLKNAEVKEEGKSVRPDQYLEREREQVAN